jgi:hypothetical protein
MAKIIARVLKCPKSDYGNKFELIKKENMSNFRAPSAKCFVYGFRERKVGGGIGENLFFYCAING